MEKGADISGWQLPNVNLAGLDFCMVKATEGTENVNRYFASQVAEVRNQKLWLGTYHYSDALDPQQEANWYHKNNDRVNGDGQALDVEGPGSSFFKNISDPDEYAYAFLSELLQLSGNLGLIYMNYQALINVKWTKTVKLGVGLWLAEWNGQNAPLPQVQQFPFWAMWQYANTSQTGGDADYFNGDLASLQKYGMNTGTPIPPKPPVPPTPKPVPPPVPKPAPRPVIQTFTVWVEAGDTMSSIAKQFNVSLQLLEQVNPQIKDFNLIYVGEAIHVPGHAPNPRKYCVVSAGDTMTSIAAQFGVTLQALEAVNPQVADFNAIYPGQVIYLP